MTRPFDGMAKLLLRISPKYANTELKRPSAITDWRIMQEPPVPQHRPADSAPTRQRSCQNPLSRASQTTLLTERLLHYRLGRRQSHKLSFRTGNQRLPSWRYKLQVAQSHAATLWRFSLIRVSLQSLSSFTWDTFRAWEFLNICDTHVTLKNFLMPVKICLPETQIV